MIVQEWIGTALKSSANPRRASVGGSILGAFAGFGINRISSWLDRSQEEDDHREALAKADKPETRTARNWWTLAQASKVQGVYHTEHGKTAFLELDDRRATFLAGLQGVSAERTAGTLFKAMGTDGKLNIPEQMITTDANGNRVYDSGYTFLTESSRARATIDGNLKAQQPQQEKGFFERIFSFGGDNSRTDAASNGIGGTQFTAALDTSHARGVDQFASAVGELPSPARPVAMASTGALGRDVG